MKRFLSLALALVLALMLLCSCGDAGSLPEGMDTAAAEAAAKEMVDALNARDFDRMVELFAGVEDYGLAAPTAAQWEATANSIESQMQPGEFVEYTTTRFTSVEDDTFGEYGVVILGTKYSKQTIAWQVSFDKEMRCIGLRI